MCTYTVYQDRSLNDIRTDTIISDLHNSGVGPGDTENFVQIGGGTAGRKSIVKSTLHSGQQEMAQRSGFTALSEASKRSRYSAIAFSEAQSSRKANKPSQWLHRHGVCYFGRYPAPAVGLIREHHCALFSFGTSVVGGQHLLDEVVISQQW